MVEGGPGLSLPAPGRGASRGVSPGVARPSLRASLRGGWTFDGETGGGRTRTCNPRFWRLSRTEQRSGPAPHARQSVAERPDPAPSRRGTHRVGSVLGKLPLELVAVAVRDARVRVAHVAVGSRLRDPGRVEEGRERVAALVERHPLDRSWLAAQECANARGRPGLVRRVPHVARRERIVRHAPEQALVAAMAGTLEVVVDQRPQRLRDRHPANPAIDFGAMGPSKSSQPRSTVIESPSGYPRTIAASRGRMSTGVYAGT
jgi:hypothetical protein